MSVPLSLQRGQATPNLCALYQVRVLNRRTSQPSETCDLTNTDVQVSWHWTLSAVSRATLTIPVDPTDPCCDCLVEPWTDLVEISRLSPTGQPEGFVWSGPVTDIAFDGTTQALIINAADRAVWAARDDEANVTISGETDEAELWYRLFTAAIAGADTGLASISYTPSGGVYDADISAGTDTELGTDTSGLLFTQALDKVKWTVIDRCMYGPGPNTVGDETWGDLDVGRDWVGDPVVRRDGAAATSQVRLSGSTSDGEDGTTIVVAYPPEPVIDPDRGRHITVATLGGVWSEETLLAEAKLRWLRDRNGHTFLVTSADTLSTDAPFTVWDMIPGRVYRVTSADTCIPVFGELMQVLNVAVNAGPTGLEAPGLMTETRVAVDFIPAGPLALPDFISV